MNLLPCALPAAARLITVDLDNISQFLASDKAPPFALGIHDSQTPEAFALNPARLIFVRYRQIDINLLFPTWYFTNHC
jgi:hypothetical protein